MKRNSLIPFFLAAFAGFAIAAEPEAKVGSPEYKHLVELIKPAESELEWLKIDWGTDLWAARQQAAKEGKPIVLWEMDGHPMGCT